MGEPDLRTYQDKVYGKMLVMKDGEVFDVVKSVQIENKEKFLAAVRQFQLDRYGELLYANNYIAKPFTVKINNTQTKIKKFIQIL